MKTVTKCENLIKKEVELYESIYRDVEENIEEPTYGIKIRDVIFEDISCDKNIVKSFINFMGKSLSGDKKAKELLHTILVETVSTFEEDIVNL